MKWIVLSLAVATNAAASILLKFVVSGKPRASILSEPISYLFDLWTWLGLALYGFAFVFYTASLSQFPLSVAHPAITAGAIVTVVAASATLFGERVDWLLILGISLVLGGLVVMGSRLGTTE